MKVSATLDEKFNIFNNNFFFFINEKRYFVSNGLFFNLVFYRSFDTLQP